ncbi:TonB-dependent receptor [Photobacterium sanguinicancri]|uniref:TonB-dependent receptor n=1 Tax=Photobacterium sanguinicancri TaxID=875932 RepID=UPI0024814FE4|nr:TonB-dependent receptor [Photobacterium sanguinicancri]
MKKHNLSRIAVACAAAFMPLHLFAAIDGHSTTKSDVDTITVVGSKPQLILDSGTATKSEMSLMQTPAAVVVVSSELIKEQGADDLQDILRNISGVTQAGNNYGIGDNLVIRGLGVNYTYDGMYGGAGLGNVFNPTRSLTNVESVEVLKGPATGLYGMGSAGGIINLIEKKPQFTPSHSVDVEVGQWNSRSVAVDTTAGITDDLAYRLVAKTARSDGYRNVGQDRDEVYGSLKYLLTDDQDIVLSAAYVKDAIKVDSIGDPVRIYHAASANGNPAGEATAADLMPGFANLTPAQQQQLMDTMSNNDGLKPHNIGDTNLVSPMAKANEGEELRLKLSHTINFTDDLFLNQQVQYRDYKSGFVRQTGAYNYVYFKKNKAPRAPLIENDVLYPYAARRQEYRKVDAHEKSWQYFADLHYHFDLGTISNELLLNANFEDRNIRLKQSSIYDADKVIKDRATGNVTYQGRLPYIYDISNPNWGAGSFEDYDPLVTSNYEKGVKAWGVGVQHVGYLGYGFTSRVGIAFNQVAQTYQHFGVDPRYRKSASQPRPEADTKDNGMTYNIGLSYMPIDDLSFFVNHAKGRTAYSMTGSIKGDGEDRKDSESISYDVGMRVKGFDDQMLASLVLFDTRRTNLRYGNPDYEDGVSGPNVEKYFNDGAERTQGVELDINAVLGEQWRMNANALYQEARDRKNPNSKSYDTLQKGVPRVTAGAWVTYAAEWFSLQNPLNVSLGGQYVGERSVAAASFGIPDAYLPSYTVVDTGVSYGQDNWLLQLNVNNLLNERYYSKAMFAGGMPGEERNATLKVSYKL